MFSLVILIANRKETVELSGFKYDDGWNDDDFLNTQKQQAMQESLELHSNVMETYARPRCEADISYKSPSKIDLKTPKTPKHKIEMYEPDSPPLTIEGSVVRGKYQGGGSSSKENPATTPLDFDGVWTNGIVSYKEPNYLKSTRLDFSMMSLNEQLSHTQSIRKYENTVLPLYEVRRLQKQEELMYVQFIWY